MVQASVQFLDDSWTLKTVWKPDYDESGFWRMPDFECPDFGASLYYIKKTSPILNETCLTEVSV